MTVSCGYEKIESRSISTIFKTKTIFHDISLPLKTTTNNQVTLCVRPSPPRSKCTFEKMHHIKVAAFAATMTAFEKKKSCENLSAGHRISAAWNWKLNIASAIANVRFVAAAKYVFSRFCYKPPQHVLLIAFPFKMLLGFLCKLVNCKQKLKWIPKVLKKQHQHPYKLKGVSFKCSFFK